MPTQSSRRRTVLLWLGAASVVVSATTACVQALALVVDSPDHPGWWTLGALAAVPLALLIAWRVPSERAGRRVLIEILTTAGLALGVVLIYVTVVVALGQPPQGSDSKLQALGAVAALVSVALAFPLRASLLARSRSFVGTSDVPSRELLATFGARMSRAVPMDELLQQLGELLRAGVGPAGAEIWVGSGGEFARRVSVPHRGDARLSVSRESTDVVARTRIAGAEWAATWLPGLPDPGGELRVAPAVHDGTVFGFLVVRRAADAEPFDDHDDRTLVELARLLALALHNVSLDSALQESLTELAQRNTELQASRLRIVTAADEARRTIERNLHDGAQTHLVALSMKAGIAEQTLAKDPAGAASLVAELRSEAGTALNVLRELAHGIYPPMLRNHGLARALQAEARRSPLTTTVDVRLSGRYPEAVEAAVYFCCLEALQNAAKYAGEGAAAAVEVTEPQDGALRFRVRDDGVGFEADPDSPGQGFVNMADRIGAVGGALTVDSAPGVGTTVTGSVPARPVS